MEENAAPSEPEKPRRYIGSVTPGELDQVTIEAPSLGSQTFDHSELATLYHQAAVTSKKEGREVEGLAYSLFQNLLEMHFKPGDWAEPYGPNFVFGDKRSITPADISAELAAGLAKHAADLKHPVLRARIADIAWVVSRKLGAAATAAIDAYCESVEALRAGKLDRRRTIGDVTDFETVDRLRRACQIAAATKGKNPFPARLAALISETRKDAFARKYLPGFSQAANLDLEFEISPPTEIAKEAEALGESTPAKGDGHLPLAILELSSTAYRAAADGENHNRMTTKAAEFCVACSETFKNAPMLESHWLTRAIAIYGRARSEKARRNELRKRLIDVQARTLDDFSPIGESINLSDIVEQVQERISGKPLATAFAALAVASRSPSPDKLRADAEAAIKQSPLSSLFSTSILDDEGKVKFQSPGMSMKDSEENETALRLRVIQQEGIRRGVLVKSTLNPARAIIQAEHGITAEKLLPLLQASPFVQPGYEFVFAQGFARWFGGELISAASTLVPQLENALRYILKNAGEDVSTMKSGGTQEDRSINSMFDNMRAEVVRVIGEAITYEIENLFLFRAGPGVRHGIAHGEFSAGHFYSDDANYACWFIFQLCFAPLLSQWAEPEAYLNSL